MNRLLTFTSLVGRMIGESRRCCRHSAQLAQQWPCTTVEVDPHTGRRRTLRPRMPSWRYRLWAIIRSAWSQSKHSTRTEDR